MARCDRCRRELIPIDVSFSKKLLGRGCEHDLCVDCIEAYFSFDDATLLRYAERWAADGCALFAFPDPDTVKKYFDSRKT